ARLRLRERPRAVAGSAAVGQSREDRPAECAAVRREFQNADARAARRKGFSGAGDAGFRVLQHTAAEGRADAAGVFPGRESLGSETADLTTLAQGSVRVADEVHRTRGQLSRFTV